MMKSKLSLVFLSLFFGQMASADVLLLVHGYMSGANTWRHSGVSQVLEAESWAEQGVLVVNPRGVEVLVNPRAASSANMVYRSVIPFEAPLGIQAELVGTMLAALTDRHAGEKIYIAAHSAGGVAARLALVTQNHANVVALITIASPHLGTPKANDALAATDIPFPATIMTDFFAPSQYNSLRRSKTLMVELSARPGSVLHWLNNQSHPDIDFIAVVRGLSPQRSGDRLVPGFSQDMNNVPALRGLAQTVMSASRHGLTPVDGRILVDTLKRLQSGA